jgi:L-arabinose isomerase
MTAAETWLRAGGPHHTCLSLALGMEAFADFAEIAGVEIAVIDEKTEAPQFEKELRWNELYYLLKGS